jgi:hypothetical protein
VIEVARTPLGVIALDPKALSSLVREAAEGVGGVRVHTLDVSFDEGGGATVTMTITATRGAVLPELGAVVQERAAGALRQALDATPGRIDVTIDGVHAEGEG